MKNLKFSLLFAAIMFVAVLGLTGCKPEPEVAEPKTEVAAPKAIEGTWVSEYGEKYIISGTDYDNFSNYGSADGSFYLYYSTNNVAIVEIDSTSGYVYGQFDDAEHIGYGASVGQWYALYYFALTDKSVKLVQAYKSGGKAGCASLDEAKEEYTIDNGYFPQASASACTKE